MERLHTPRHASRDTQYAARARGHCIQPWLVECGQVLFQGESGYRSNLRYLLRPRHEKCGRPQGSVGYLSGVGRRKMSSELRQPASIQDSSEYSVPWAVFVAWLGGGVVGVGCGLSSRGYAVIRAPAGILLKPGLDTRGGWILRLIETLESPPWFFL